MCCALAHLTSASIFSCTVSGKLKQCIIFWWNMWSLQILPPVSGALFSSDLCCSDFLLRELLLSYFSVSLSDYHCYGWWFAWHFTPVALVPSWWMENCLMFIYILWTSCFPVWTNLAIFVYCGFLIRVICTRRIFRSGDYTLHTVKVSSWW